MTDRRVEAVVLAAHGIRLEALTLAHEDGLAEAAADGELWQLRVTSVPAPGETRACIESPLPRGACAWR